MAEDITVTSTDEQKRAAYASSQMMGWKRVTLGAAANRLLTFSVTVPAGITATEISTLRAAIGALPNVGVAVRLTQHPVEHFAGFNTILAVQTQVTHEPVPAE